MCVHDHLLSAYLDGELEPAERKKIEGHLETCSQCRDRLTQIRRASALLTDPDLEQNEILLSQKRVSERLDHVLAFSDTRSFWTRRFSLPAPMAAAAAFAFLLVSGFALSGFIPERGVRIQSIPMAERPYVEELNTLAGQVSSQGAPQQAPEQKLQDFIRLLEHQGASIKLEIELPEESSFTVHGEPQLLRAADFHGGVQR